MTRKIETNKNSGRSEFDEKLLKLLKNIDLNAIIFTHLKLKYR